MKFYGFAFVLLTCCTAFAEKASGAGYKLALPDHNGQHTWVADSFKITQSSAKPDGREIGIRGQDNSGRLAFLGFLFLVPNGDKPTGAKCRDETLAQEKQSIPSLSVLRTADLDREGGLPISQVTYSTAGRNGLTEFHVRGFIASNGICGDLVVYSSNQIHETDADVARIFSTYRFDSSYLPRFADVVLYGQIRYDTKNYQAAAPRFEKALTMLSVDGAPFPSSKVARRVLTDQAGMAYGMSGNFGKARSIFEAGIAADPEYPLYYYNLACPDAGEDKLSDARLHLQQAFAHRANLIRGEKMPDLTTDDSFVPYKGNREFWAFVEHLQGSK